MKKNVAPGVSRKLDKASFDNFSRGTIKDAPASEISNCISDGTNLTIFPTYIEGRTGCRKYTDEALPAATGRTGYSAHKSNNHILSDSGDIFTPEDVGNYFNFGGTCELITDYVSASEVVGSNSTYRYGVECSIIGMPNVFGFHRALKKWFVIAYGELYFADISISAWKKVRCISINKPSASRSDYSEYKNNLIIFNSKGLFKAEIGSTYPIIYDINVESPDVKVVSDTQQETDTASYKYLYSAAMMLHDGNVGRVDGIAINFETGTNKPDDTEIDCTDSFTANEISSTNPNVIGPLHVPKIAGTETYHQHITHFPIYRTRNLEAKDVDDVTKSSFNDPNRFTLVKDLRICAAFYGSIIGEYFYINSGEFEPEDVGSILGFPDGTRMEILEYVNSTKAKVESGYYGSEQLYVGSAAIGYGRIFEGYVTDGVFTKTLGDDLVDSDVGKIFYSSSGNKLIVDSVQDVNTATFHTTITLSDQAFTTDATHRNFCDITDDGTLHARQDYFDCINRYRDPLPSGNVGCIIPGFVVVGIRGKSQVTYSQVKDTKDQYMGVHFYDVQTSDDIKDEIQKMWVFEGTLAVVCAMTTWGISTGISDTVTLPSSTEVISKLPTFRLIDKNTGCLDPDSVSEIEGGSVVLITNEPGGESLRYFDGLSYSKTDYLVDDLFGGRIVKLIKGTVRKSIAIYDGLLGYVNWRKSK